MHKPLQPSTAAEGAKAADNRRRFGSLYRPDEWKYSLAAGLIMGAVALVGYFAGWFR